MYSPLISVIVIGYNIEKYIENSIKSILSQDYCNYEMIFVDDGSTDGTLKIVRKYEENERVKIIAKSNGGIVSARKAGVLAAMGDYVTFVDGDDWLNTNMLTNLVRVLEDDNTIDIVSSNMMQEEENGMYFLQANKIPSGIYVGNTYFEYIMGDLVNHHMFPKLYKKSFIIEAGYIDYPEVTMAEDLMTNAFFGVSSPKVFFSDSTNYFYRYNAASVMRKGDNMLLRQKKTLEFMEDYFKEQGIYDSNVELIDYQWISYVFNYCHAKVSGKIKQEIVAACREKIRVYNKNVYFKKLLKEYPVYVNLFFYGYYYVPAIMAAVDPLLFKIKKKIHYIRKNREVKNEYKYKKARKSYYSKQNEQVKSIAQNKKMYLIGTSDRSNIGDHAIALSEVRMLKKWFPGYGFCEITGDHYRFEKDLIKQLISTQDIIFITGGGFLGDLWMDEEKIVRDILESFDKNKVVILPQTIHFTDTEVGKKEYEISKKIYEQHKNLLILARDRKSWEFINRMLPQSNNGLYPDMALFLEERLCDVVIKNEALVCFRDDKEGILSLSAKEQVIRIISEKGIQCKNTSTLNCGEHNGDIVLAERESYIKSKLAEFHASKLVITDRLHGMILSCLAGTPCIAFDNSSHKVSGVYDEWMRSLPYVMVIHEVSELKEALHAVFSVERKNYSRNYLNDKILEMEKELITFIE